ncbi:MAG: hypothetical protein HZA50_14425 [Planctomycetes bacterium]|nr:hypothetical protein [Planctomycetota bacterium]
MDISGKRFETSAWNPVRGAGSPKTPEENLSLAAEIFILHDHIDEPSPLGWAAGLMVNRHVWPGRTIECPPMIGRDAKGEDETPTGAYISLASRPKGDDGLGGELLPEGPDDRRTAHQREWDFLQQHVQWAYATYRGRHINPRPPTGLSEWQKVEALAQYAIQWKMRTADTYASFHPVDVMMHSSHCTGAANVLLALAMVAGFESRFIAISNHSMVEIRVNDNWIWADNIWADGSVTPTCRTYAEITENPFAIACLSGKQREFCNGRVTRYRSPYHYGGRFYWHFCWGDGKGRGSRTDIADGYGLSVPYDPATAAALYPESRRHAFHVMAGWPAAVNVSEQGALVRARLDLPASQAARKCFHITASPDNPVGGGRVKLPLAAEADQSQAACAIDGTPLKPAGRGVRFKNPALDFDIPAGLLAPGRHELIVTTQKGPLPVWLYPDIVKPYHPPLLGGPTRVADSAFHINPYLGGKEINELREPF